MTQEEQHIKFEARRAAAMDFFTLVLAASIVFFIAWLSQVV